MFGLGRQVPPGAEWKRLVASKRPAFMSRGEKIKMALVVGGLLAFLGGFYQLTQTVRRLGRTNAPELAGSAGTEAAAKQAADEAARSKEREWTALWNQMKREHDLPSGSGPAGSTQPAAEVGAATGAATGTATGTAASVAPGDAPAIGDASPSSSAAPSAGGSGATASSTRAVVPASPAASPAPTRPQTADERRREAAKREEWVRVEREYGLPKGFDRSALPPIDAGLLLWVDDGSSERERAPYEHLLRYTLSRTQAELDAEARKDVSFEWLRRRDLSLDERMARSKALRGTIVTVYGTVLSSYERRLETKAEGEALRPWVWEVVLRDKDGVAFLVVSPDKQVEAEAGDVVKASGPYFKLLRVRTEDGKDRGFPLVVARALRRVEDHPPSPRLFSNALLKVLAVICALALAVSAGLWVRGRREPPQPPRRRSRLHDERLRSLDRTSGSGAVGGGQKEASAPAPDTPHPPETPPEPDTQPPADGTDAAR